MTVSAAHRKVDVLCRVLARRIGDEPVGSILAVGCGDGREAAYLADFFGADVVGIDLDDRFDPEAARRVDLRIMDATRLGLADDTFDLVYSFHALEHITDPEAALDEMQRVLRPGGRYCIGTPNRHRVVGYVGSRTTRANKIRWNLQDYGMRLRGRFRNEYGAHAGFTATELRQACLDAFGDAEDVTEEYYGDLYEGGRTGTALATADAVGLSRFLYPCVYIVGSR